MLRTFSRVHRWHSQVLRPLSIPDDQPIGAGSPGAWAPQRWHTVVARSSHAEPTGQISRYAGAGGDESDPPAAADGSDMLLLDFLAS